MNMTVKFKQLLISDSQAALRNRLEKYEQEKPFHPIKKTCGVCQRPRSEGVVN